jgi:hypothetical protein
MEARKLFHLYLYRDYEIFDFGTCGQGEWNARSSITCEGQLSKNEQQPACQEISIFCGKNTLLFFPVNIFSRTWCPNTFSLRIAAQPKTVIGMCPQMLVAKDLGRSVANCASSVNIAKAGKLGLLPYFCKNHWENHSRTGQDLYILQMAAIQLFVSCHSLRIRMSDSLLHWCLSCAYDRSLICNIQNILFYFKSPGYSLFAIRDAKFSFH